MSGRGRCPYNPDSPVTSTLAGKTQLAKSVSISCYTEVNTRETLFCGARAISICMCDDSTARRFKKEMLPSCGHMPVTIRYPSEGVAPLRKHVQLTASIVCICVCFCQVGSCTLACTRITGRTMAPCVASTTRHTPALREMTGGSSVVSDCIF